MAEQGDLGLTVSIGAKTDSASFDKAEATIKGFAADAKKDLGSIGPVAAEAGQELTDAFVGPVQPIEQARNRLDAINTEILKLAADGSPRGIKALAKLQVEAKDLGKTFDLTEKELKGLDAGLKTIDKSTKAATNSITRQKAAMFQLSDAVRDDVAQGKLSNELWDDSRGKFGRLTNAVGMLGAAFSGGFATGVQIAKKAGIDFTESLAVLNDVGTFLADSLNKGITDALGWVTEKLGKLMGVLASFSPGFKGAFLAAEQFLKTTAEGFDGLADAQKKKRDDDEKAAKAQEEAILLANEQILKAEIYNQTHKQSVKGIKAVTAAQVALATAEKKSALEIQKIKVEGAKNVKEFIRAEKEDRDQLDKDLRAIDERYWQEHLDRVRRAYQSTEGIAAAFAAKKVAAAQTEIALLGPTGPLIENLRKAKTLEIAITAKTAEEKLAAEMALDEEIANLQMQALERERALGKIELGEYKKRVAAILKLTSLGAEARFQIEAQATEARIELGDRELTWEGMNARQKRDYVVAGANTQLAVYAQAFPENKEIKIAQTIMNTYDAAMGAYSALSLIPYVGPVLGALAAAAAVKFGLDQVGQIRAQKPPSQKKIDAPSFDDPANDAAARFAGQQSARDLVNHFRGGHNYAMRQELATGTAFERDGNTTRATSFAGRRREGKIELHVHGHVSTPPREYVKAFTRAQRVQSKTVEKKVIGNRGYAVG